MCFMNVLNKPLLNGYYSRLGTIVFWFIETKSHVQTQRRCKIKHGKDPPPRSSIRRWHKKFMETGPVLDAVEVADQEHMRKILRV